MPLGVRHGVLVHLSTNLWVNIEVSRGCNVPLPPIFSYKGSSLMDRESGYWVVAYTKMCASSADFVLDDTYDSSRLWALSRQAIKFMHQIDLTLVLGSAVNVVEFRGLMTLIDRTPFDRYLESQANRGELGI